MRTKTVLNTLIGLFTAFDCTLTVLSELTTSIDFYNEIYLSERVHGIAKLSPEWS
jgi:hypothetical protein